MSKVEVFVYLQLLDFLTTLVGLRLGCSELSPFVGMLMQFDVVFGLCAVKMNGLVLGGICLWKRPRVIFWVNYIFAGLVVWNLFNILRALGPPAGAPG